MALIFNVVVLYFCVLLLGTISGIFSERAGIVNIAINGFLIFGALIYAVLSIIIGHIILSSYPEYTEKEISSWLQIPIIIISALATGLFSLLFGFATIKLKSDQTVSGFAINILVVGITGLLVIVLLAVQKASTTLTLPFRGELALSTNRSEWSNLLSIKIIVTLIVAGISWFALRKTRWGLRFRAIGENPQAADVAGINVNAKKWQGVVLAGIVAGIGGSFFAQSNIVEFSATNDVAGLGFISLAIMITSRWKISISIIVSFLFSLMISFSSYGISLFGPSIEKYSDLLLVIPYLLTLIVIIFQSKNSYGPAAAGIPYDKSKR